VTEIAVDEGDVVVEILKQKVAIAELEASLASARSEATRSQAPVPAIAPHDDSRIALR
jgi:Tfp pilus assembly protein FimT